MKSESESSTLNSHDVYNDSLWRTVVKTDIFCYPHSRVHDSILSSIVDVVKCIHQAQKMLEHKRTSQIASLSHTIISMLPIAFQIAFLFFGPIKCDCEICSLKASLL